jgi:DUF1680 family protein
MVNSISWKQVKINDGLLKERQNTIASATLDHIFEKYEQKGRLGAATWHKGMPNEPHYFYDSDVAKLIEAVAYSLVHFPDEVLKNRTVKVIEDLIAIQEPDGYLNSYFHNVAPDEKWTDLRIKHELYCAGHLIEAAIAWYQSTGDEKLLNAMRRYADLICDKFGDAAGQICSWPGHQEIELAMIRLHELTKDNRYLKNASFFVKSRGVDASYWCSEAEKLGLDSSVIRNNLQYFQAHLPAEDQDSAEGHAVRACYFYCGMADVARENGDEKLFEACRKIWRNIVDKRMNVTGGIGSDWQGERFTYDYDLAEEYYYETCAQISLFFFAWRMFLNEQKSEYGDIMELTLYNSILSGIDAPGKAFFYSNPLVSVKRNYRFDKELPKHWGVPVRQQDFRCSCCPPNMSRFIMSIGQYIYTTSKDTVWINLFTDSEAELRVGDNILEMKMQTNYPWSENVKIDVMTKSPAHCKVKIRIPGWCRKFDLKINSTDCDFAIEDGFAVVDRTWINCDCVDLHLSMPVEMLEAHAAVRQAAGKVVVKRGPVVYCLEEADNGSGLFNILLSPETEFRLQERGIAGFKLPVIEFNAKRKENSSEEALYYPVQNKFEDITATAIPYFMWANRGENEMTVWIKQG